MVARWCAFSHVQASVGRVCNVFRRQAVAGLVRLVLGAPLELPELIAEGQLAPDLMNIAQAR